VVYNCGSSQPQLLRLGDPFYRLMARPKGGVVIPAEQVLSAGES